MNETGRKTGSRLLRYLGRVVRLLVFVAVYILVVWYGIATTANLEVPSLPLKIAIAFIALGVTGSTCSILARAASETKGGIMVLAEFLNTNLLEPLKQRLRDEGYAEGVASGRAEGVAQGRAEGVAEGVAQGRAEGVAEGVAQGRAEGVAEGRAEGVAEGRAEAIAMMRSQLLENGINPDVLFPADTP